MHILFFLLTISMSFAKTTLYQGEALKDGKLIYVEKHEVTDDESGRPLRAKTSYLRADGNVIATLSSDFSSSITNAEHEMHDQRDQRRYGVRWSENRPTMWDINKGKERTKKLTSDYAKGRLLIGGQGLHYHMRDKLEELKKVKLPIAILIPGQLDYYSFLVAFDGIENDLIKFSITAQSAFIRIFAPKLEVWYTPDGKLIRYKGLSNLADDKGGNQIVEIKYKYEG
jgi:hypothetical protein